MARVNNLSNFLTDVASAIKEKKGDNTNIPAANFDTEILSLPSQGIYQSKQVNISTNGNYNILPDNGYDAMEAVYLNVDIAHESGAGSVKLFNTEQDMQADETAVLDDLAVVYGDRFNRWIGTSTRSVNIAKNVTLPEQVIEDLPVCNLDSHNYSSITLTPTSCIIKYTPWRAMTISYTSTDGIHYTTTSTVSTISNRIYMAKPTDGTWSDLFGYFIGTSAIEFEGLYKYTNHQDEEYCYFPKISSINYTYNSSSSTLSDVYTYYTKYDKSVKIADLTEMANKIITEQSLDTSFTAYHAMYGEDNELYYCYNTSAVLRLMFDLDKNMIGIGYPSTSTSSNIPRIFKVDIKNMTYTEVLFDTLGIYNIGGTSYCTVNSFKPVTYPVYLRWQPPKADNEVNIAVSNKTSGAQGSYKNSFPTVGYTNSYVYAPTDLSNTLPENITIGNKLYTASGLVTGTMANNGKLIYNSTFSEKVIPQGYTSGGVIHPVNMPHIANHSQVGGNRASSVTRKRFSVEKFYYICSCYCKRRCYNASWLGIFR